MAGSLTRDIFDSPALPLLLRLEAEGFELQAGPDVLRVRPADRLTPDLVAELVHHKPDLLLLMRCRDSGVAERCDVFRAQLDRAPGGRVPCFLFRAGVPYVEGVCFSCGDALQTFRIGRCARCALGWRLAARVPMHADVAAALDGARVV